MRFTDCTYEELAELAPLVQAVFVPLGCTEQQGPQMTVDFDTLMITSLCEAIAGELEGRHGITTLVMPTLPFGPTPEHEGFGHGYINLRQSTHEAILEDILDSLSEQGFRKLLVWRGCGQHELNRPIEAFNAGQKNAHAYQPLLDYGRISQAVLGDVPGGHADSFATSVCLHLDEGRVRPEQIRLPLNGAIDWSGPVNFVISSDTGVVGDPTKATTRAGAEIWTRCVEAGLQAVLDLLEDRPVPEDWHFKQTKGKNIG